MPIGNNLGFTGNYAFKCKDSNIAGKLGNVLLDDRNERINAGFKSDGSHLFRIYLDNNDPTIVNYRTNNSQFSQNDFDMLNSALNSSIDKQFSITEKRSLINSIEKTFNENATKIDLTV